MNLLENDEICMKTANRSEPYEMYGERGNAKFECKVRFLQEIHLFSFHLLGGLKGSKSLSKKETKLTLDCWNREKSKSEYGNKCPLKDVKHIISFTKCGILFHD